jgi:hypothetical protein
MARKLELKTVSLNSGLEGEFNYGQHLLAILQFDQQTGGMSFDDVIKRTDAMKPIQAAIADGSEEVILTDEQWRTVVEKLNRFQFRFADEAIVAFGLMVRDAREIGAGQQPEP